MFNTRCFLLAAGLLGAAVAGCGADGPEIAGVEGTVTMDGKPLPNAAVVFVPEEGGRPAGARTDENGHYVLNFSGGRQGTIPGKNKVQITTLSDPYQDEEGNTVPGSPETVPMKYNTQTTLEVDVKEGEHNVADFDLDSEGDIAVAAE